MNTLCICICMRVSVNKWIRVYMCKYIPLHRHKHPLAHAGTHARKKYFKDISTRQFNKFITWEIFKWKEDIIFLKVDVYICLKQLWRICILLLFEWIISDYKSRKYQIVIYNCIHTIRWARSGSKGLRFPLQ